MQFIILAKVKIICVVKMEESSILDKSFKFANQFWKNAAKSVLNTILCTYKMILRWTHTTSTTHSSEWMTIRRILVSHYSALANFTKIAWAMFNGKSKIHFIRKLQGMEGRYGPTVMSASMKLCHNIHTNSILKELKIRWANCKCLTPWLLDPEIKINSRH